MSQVCSRDASQGTPEVGGRGRTGLGESWLPGANEDRAHSTVIAEEALDRAAAKTSSRCFASWADAQDCGRGGVRYRARTATAMQHWLEVSGTLSLAFLAVTNDLCRQ